MQCERCGKEIDASAAFCPYCGYVVTNKNEQKSNGQEARNRNCLKCGAALEDGAKFCAACGTRVETTGVMPTARPTQSVKKVVYVRRCKVCGEKVPVNEYYCPHCHTTMGTQSSGIHSGGVDKSRLGFWTSFFFGLLALIVGVCMYPSGSTERTTFVDGWVKGFIMSIVIVIAFVVFVCCSVSCLALSA